VNNQKIVGSFAGLGSENCEMTHREIYKTGIFSLSLHCAESSTIGDFNELHLGFTAP